MLATAFAALALAACGGDEGSNESSGYSDFTTATNEICSEQIPPLDALANDLTGDAANDAPILAELADKTKAFVEDIQDLDQPDELTDAVTERNAILNEQYERVTRAQELAEAGTRRPTRPT